MKLTVSIIAALFVVLLMGLDAADRPNILWLVLDWSHMDITPYITAIDSLDPVGGSIVGEEQRMVQYLRESHGLPVPPATQAASESQKKKDAAKDM